MDVNADTVTQSEMSVLLERFVDIMQRLVLEKEEIQSENNHLEQTIAMTAKDMVDSVAETEEVKQETLVLRNQVCVCVQTECREKASKKLVFSPFTVKSRVDATLHKILFLPTHKHLRTFTHELAHIAHVLTHAYTHA